MPIGAAELVAGLHQREEGVPAIAAVVRACAGADLAAGDLAADVVFRAVGMERDVGTLQYPEQVRLMGKKAREQPV